MLDQPGQIRSQRDVFSNRRGNATLAVVTQRQPDLQRAKPSRQLWSIIPKSKRLVCLFLKHLDVVRILFAKRRPRARFVAKQEAATIKRRVQPLMWIQGDRISAREANKKGAFGFVKRG